MKLDSFIQHVSSSVNRQLQELDSSAEMVVDIGYNFVLFYGITNEKVFQKLLTHQEANLLKARGSYLLDRSIWEEIRKVNTEICLTSHYLQTVFSQLPNSE